MQKLLNKLYGIVAPISAKTGIRGDYILHFSACFILSLIGHWWLAAILGIGKEVKDSWKGGSGWSWLDLVADGLGIAAGLAVNMAIKAIIN